MPILQSRVTRTAALLLLVAGRPALAGQSPGCIAHDFAQKYPALTGQILRVAQDADSAPYAFPSTDDPSVLVGIDADFARAVFDCIGVTVEFVTGSWSGLLPGVVAGQSDVMWNGLYYTRERASQVDYVTYMVGATGGLVRKGNPKRIAGMSDLCGLRAVASLNSIEYALLREQSLMCRADRRSSVELVAFTTSAGGEHLLDNNRTDLLLTDSAVAARIAKAQGDRYEIAFSSRANLPIGVAVRKGRADLEHAVRDAIHLLQTDGTQRSLLVKYGVDPALEQTPEVIRQ